MITHWRRPARADRTLSRLPAVALLLLVACSSALGGNLAAETRSHTHHPVATALPSTSFVVTGSSRGTKKRKSGTHDEQPAAARRTGTARSGAARGTSARASKPGKAQHGRSRSVEPADDFIPMSRAELRTARRSGRGQRDLAYRDEAPPRARNIGRAEYRNRFTAMRSSAPPLQWRPRSRSGSSDLALSSSSANRPDAGRNRFASASRTRNASQPLPENTFAQGVSHPEEDERAPRTFAEANIGTAEILTAPTSRTRAFASANVASASAATANPAQPATGGSQSQVVQGFGSEVAVMPSDPGTTRRRNHPIPASALPGMTPPPTLEERDAITEAAVSPAVLPEIYDRDGRLLMPAPLKGSREVLVHQNTMADNDGLERIQDDAALDRLRANRELVGFPSSDALRVNEALPYNRRYARPWTVLFAGDIAHDFFNRFHEPIYVTSAVRTVNYQARLQRVNGNAAATAGDAASPHLTGQAIDLAKRGMSAAELAWMRAYLLPLMSAGKIDVEEEFQQACFHISVYRRYTAGRRSVQFAQVRSVAHPDAADDSNLP